MKVEALSLRSIADARGLSLTSLSSRSSISKERLESGGRFSDEEVETLADELAVPVRSFFAGGPLGIEPLVDFRSNSHGRGRFAKGTLKALSFVEQISHAVSNLGATPELHPSLSPVTLDLTLENAVTLAKNWRSKWGLTVEQQLDMQNAHRVYLSLREFIERMGVVVIHRSFNTDEAAGFYVKVGDGPHTIVINSSFSSKARKLFTLAHEFCHLLIRAEGASNPSVLKNSTEKFCNRFAANLIAPKELIVRGIARYGYTVSIDGNFIRLLAKNLGISQEALVRRLVEIRLLELDQYREWRSRFSGGVPPGDIKDGGGRGDPLQAKRTIYGSRLLSILAEAKRRGQVDEIDVYRLSGLKPKYQNPLFEAA